LYRYVVVDIVDLTSTLLVCGRIEAGLYKSTHSLKAPGFNPCT
jgi:hypothetical protein